MYSKSCVLVHVLKVVLSFGWAGEIFLCFFCKKSNSSTHHTHIRLKFQNIPANTDFNFDRQEAIICSCDRLFLSNHSLTNCCVFPWKYAVSIVIGSWYREITRASQNQREVIFYLPHPATTGKGPLQTISHPRDGRAGLSTGMVTGQIKPCIIE